MLHTAFVKLSLIALTIMLIGCQSYRQPTERVNTFIVTPVPEAKEVLAAPAGYSKCFMVEESFFQDWWVAAHRVCRYENVHGKVIMLWISGYWACTRYDKRLGGACHAWLWKPAHMVHFSTLLPSEESIKLYY